MSLDDIERALNKLIALSSVSVVVKDRKALAAAGNYEAEDVMSESATAGKPWFFKDMAKKVGGSGYITKGQALLQTTALTPALTVYLFTKKPTSAVNDNVANTAPIYADIPYYVGKIDFPELEDLGGVSEAVVSPSTAGNLPLQFTCAPSSKDLWGIVVTRDAITGEAATETLDIRLSVEQY